MKYLIILLICFSFSSIGGMLDTYPTGKVTIKVINEKGELIKNADIVVGFRRLKNFNNPFDGQGVGVGINGKTDENGTFIAEESGLSGIAITAKMESYYRSYKEYRFDEPVWGKWQPWNPTITLRMRKKINPVPMYAKKAQDLGIPNLKEPVGYDFLIGDLVEPYGKGKVSDMLFTFKLEYEKEIDTRYGKDIRYGYQIEVKMPNKGDGFCPIPKEQIIPESDFKLPYEAPENGYVEKLVFTQDDEKNIKSLEPDADNYFIRIRTEFDENGKIKKALYGKFIFSNRINRIVYYNKKLEFIFTYYVNPDGTRNMEFDPEKNLFIPKGAQRERYEYRDYHVGL